MRTWVECASTAAGTSEKRSHCSREVRQHVVADRASSPVDPTPTSRRCGAKMTSSASSAGTGSKLGYGPWPRSTARRTMGGAIDRTRCNGPFEGPDVSGGAEPGGPTPRGVEVADEHAGQAGVVDRPSTRVTGVGICAAAWSTSRRVGCRQSDRYRRPAQAPASATRRSSRGPTRRGRSASAAGKPTTSWGNVGPSRITWSQSSTARLGRSAGPRPGWGATSPAMAASSASATTDRDQLVVVPPAVVGDGEAGCRSATGRRSRPTRSDSSWSPSGGWVPPGRP